jgi:hypothetical protein
MISADVVMYLLFLSSGVAEPSDARWIPLSRLNHDTGKVESQGSILVTIEIMPKEEADNMPGIAVSHYLKGLPFPHCFFTIDSANYSWRW